ncbi:Bap-like [Trichomonas vaginalis G3]|uniref:Bap-like n=1 Tax=Trichomonas vaginalis (strain ATCC PRA-98 / G3) TaxID=412133 RepID=A2DTB7_TRIV3|nr:Hep Hag repeat protein family [Trichomonas vaginalis G3]EAY16389.1 Bap-like [Trichomonas vaginalis G3]KAI5488383.1 Hep Hag repeat protein family [Trichomonas vaginalis G3]|eukprot:XP_001328612.1 Bap-like [Trichomonas vaginalis G3]
MLYWFSTLCYSKIGYDLQVDRNGITSNIQNVGWVDNPNPPLTDNYAGWIGRNFGLTYANGLKLNVDRDHSWRSVLKLPNEELKTYAFKNGELDEDGITGKTVFEYITNDTVRIKWIINNTNNEDKIYDFGHFYDVNMNGDDNAALIPMEEGRGFFMESGDYKLALYVRNAYGVSNVDAFFYGPQKQWGYFWLNEDNIDKSLTPGTYDSLFCFSWRNRLIEAHEVHVYSIVLGAGLDLHLPPDFYFTQRKELYNVGEEIIIRGKYEADAVNSELTLEYQIDDMPTETLPLFRVTEQEKGKDFSITVNPEQNKRGPYNIRVKVSDQYDQEFSDTISFVVNSPPTYTLTNTINTAYEKGKQIQVKGNLNDDSKAKVQYKLDNGEFVKLEYVVSNSQPQEFNFEIDTASLSLGQHTLVISSIDEDNAEQTTPITKEFYVRSTPKISDVTLDSQKYGKSQEIEVTFSINDQDPDDEITIYAVFSNSAKKNIGKTTPIIAGKKLKFQIPSDVNIGSTSIVFRAVDKYQLSSQSEPINIEIVTTPVITITGTDKNDYVPGETVNVNINVEDANGDVTVSAKLPGQSEPSAITRTGNGASFTIPDNLAPGTHDIEIQVKDSNGVPSEPKTIKIKIYAKPALECRRTATETVYTGEDFSVVCTFSDQDVGDRITIRGKAANKDMVNEHSFDTTPQNHDETLAFTLPETTTRGDVSIVLTATDSHGYSTQSSPIVIKCEVRPTVTDTRTDKNDYAPGETVKIAFTTANTEGTITAEGKFDDNDTKIPITKTDEGGKFMIPENLPPGQHTFKFVVKDENGDLSKEVDVPITVYAKPSLSCSRSSSQTAYAGEEIQVLCNYADEDIGDKLTIKINVGSQTLSNEYFYDITEGEKSVVAILYFTIPKNSETGDQNVVFTATDKYGYSANSTINVNIAKRPTISLGSNDKDDYAAGETVNIEFRTENTHGEITVEGKFEGTSVNIPIQKTDSGAQLTVPENTAPGTHILKFVVKDEAGHTSKEVRVPLTVYSRPMISCPRELKDPVFVGEEVSVVCTISDKDQGDKITVTGKIGGADISGQYIFDASAEGKNENLKFTVPENAETGNKQIIFTAVDTHQYRSESAPITVTIIKRLVINFESNDKNNYAPGEKVKIKFSTTNTNGEVTANGKFDNTETSVTKTEDGAEFTIPENTQPGTHTFTLTVRDPEGQESKEVPITIIVYAKPVLKLKGLDKGKLIPDEEFIATCILSDKDKGDEVKITVTVNGEPVSDAFSFSTTQNEKEVKLKFKIPAGTSVGGKRYNLIATDKYGYKSEQVSFTITVVSKPKIVFKNKDKEDYNAGENVTMTFTNENTDTTNKKFTVYVKVGDNEPRAIPVEVRPEFNVSFELPTNMSTTSPDISIYVVDENGKPSDPISFNNFNINMPPMIELLEFEKENYVGEEELVIMYRIYDLNQDEHADVYVKVDEKEFVNATRVKTNNLWVNYSVTIKLAKDIESGEHNVTIFAKDKKQCPSLMSSKKFNVAEKLIENKPGIVKKLLPLWIILALILLLVIIALIIFFIIYNKDDKQEEEEDAPDNYKDELSGDLDSGETVDISDNDVDKRETV